MWYLYMHKNKINGKVYIGKAVDVQNRWANNGAKYKTCPRFWSAISSYGWDNFEHIILEEKVQDDEIDEKEMAYIKKYNSLYPNGYNLAKGGTGGDTWVGKTEEEKIAYAEARRQETLSRGQEWHDKLSDAQIKRWTNSEEKEKASLRNMGGKNHEAKKCQCVETGEIFESYADAAAAYGYPRSYGAKIGMVIRGERKTCCGHHWRAI